MNKIKLPSDDEISNDINSWVSKEEALEDAYQMIDFQTDYCVDLCSAIDYPKIDFELIKKHFYDWEHDKEANILTYRDKSFSSPVTGTTGPSHHTTWLEAMDDSMATYLDTK